MAEYYSTRPSVQVAATLVTSDPNLSEFDKHHESLLLNDIEEGWVEELCCYLETLQHDIKKDADIVEWWQVSCSFSKILLLLI